MKYPKRKIQCEACKGYKRVAVLKHGVGPFKDIVGKPLALIFIDAKNALLEFKKKEGKGMARFIIDDAISALDTTPCPWCEATGFAFEVRQLTDEEASQFR